MMASSSFSPCKTSISPSLANLTGPDGSQAHSVFNHTLLSPRQVTLNLAMGPSKASLGLVGGRSSQDSRLIGVLPGLPEEPPAIKNCNKGFVNNALFQDDELEFDDNSLLEAEPSQGYVQGSTDESDPSGYSGGSDMDDLDVGHFINYYLVEEEQCKPQTQKDTDFYKPKSPQKDSDMFAFFQKQTEVLEQNNNALQKQIDALREQTAFQTKVLKKLLMKKTRKRLKKDTE
ncbi:predicted protein [Nematostella vectensis]|uniref:Uncharacterized protein n=1 Tax=Nematostella vectensis TaxID=45351 RepID=A7RL83_NEMVE|nr:uncharacterized protein LOC5520020 isoform X1 [Nematostella vectensis]XP_032220932.1 uncharacterized protein LOC5520020 isoform X2 [Nematostella vectensis]EDO47819.1 predicted protein [Nematostella vectensis]|eukprot:XP_001639882.1 predicted protein [Nematostella vectensis]